MPDAVLVEDLGAVDSDFDHQALRVHELVALPAPHPLAAIEAPLLAADPGGLTVHDPGAL